MLKRELQAGGSACEQHRHRIPIGLLLLEHGWITQKQLQSALKSQKQAGTGRIGEWLIRQGATDESTVARALGLQWSCPVLLPTSVDGGPACVVPRVLIQQTAGVPLRLAGHPIYLGFEQSIDPVMGLALQRITGQQVETGIVPSSTFHVAMKRVLRGPFPRAQFVEAANASAAARQFARAVERHHPVASRLVRVHQYIWLRMWLAEDGASAGVDNLFDVICTIGAFEFSRSRRSTPVPMNQE